MLSREQQIEALQLDWDTNPRWKGVKRTYSAADVVRLRGSISLERVGYKLHKKCLDLVLAQNLATQSGEVALVHSENNVWRQFANMQGANKWFYYKKGSIVKPDNNHRKKICYGVSYAWTDESKARVANLCRCALAQGVDILVDTATLCLGDSITTFMQRLSLQDRVFIILSEKYFKSQYCMYELCEIWRNSRGRDEDFLKCVKVYKMKDVEISSAKARATIAAYWKGQFAELDNLVKQHGADILGVRDFENYKRMQGFVHEIGDILHAIEDVLRPADFDELVKIGFA